jgi:hypothetical protein
VRIVVALALALAGCSREQRSGDLVPGTASVASEGVATSTGGGPGEGSFSFEADAGLVSTPDARPVRITGEVVDETGVPIARAEVTALDPFASSALTRGWTGRTDPLGRFAIDLPDRGWSNGLQVEAEGFVGLRITSSWFAADGVVQLPALVLRPGGALSVRAIDGEGEPIAALVVARAVRSAGRIEGARDSADGRSGPDGRVRLTGLAPGTHRVHVRARGYADRQADADVAAGRETEVVVTLEPLVDVEGRVVGGPEEVRRARMRVFSPTELVGSLVVKDGVFRLGAPPGPLLVMIEGPDGRLGVADVDLADGRGAGVDLSLDRPAAVRGRLLYGPRPHLLSVRLLRAGAVPWEETCRLEEETYESPPLVSGRWTLSVSRDGEDAEVATLDLRPGDLVEQDVIVPAGRRP